MSVPDLTPTEWEALGTWAGVLVALAGVLVALGAVVFAAVQIAQARRVRIEQAKPDVVAYLVLEGHVVDLVIRNFGPTAALDVRIKVAPPARRALGPRGIEPVWLPEVIPVLAPGQEWRTFWDAGSARSRSELVDEDRHEAHLTWRSNVPGAKEGESRSVLDWGAHKGYRYVERHTIHDVAAALKAVAATIGGWGEKPPTDAGGLSVYVRDGSAKDRALLEGWNAWRASAEAADEAETTERRRATRRVKSRPDESAPDSEASGQDRNGDGASGDLVDDA